MMCLGCSQQQPWLLLPSGQQPPTSIPRRLFDAPCGDPAALELLGFTADVDHLDVRGPTLRDASVTLGGAIAFTADITNLSDGPAILAVDYVIHHRKANGSTSPKTFKLTTKTLMPLQHIQVVRQHPIKPITTRRYYPGVHGLELQINGRRFGYVEFALSLPT